MLAKVLKECKSVSSWTDSQSLLQHGKRQTFWLEMREEEDERVAPRSYIEKAIGILRRYAKSELFGSSKQEEQTILGAEWWVQMRTSQEGISFHYDKDEGLASMYGKMKHPLVSTVTYLSDTGAPTLIFNMTTPDGNLEVPEIPTQGFISYPKLNRHILFSGDLQHGVLGSAAPPARSSSSSSKRSTNKGNEERVTLLINWWSVRPLEPNTIELTDDMAEKMQLMSLYAPSSSSTTSVGRRGRKGKKGSLSVSVSGEVEEGDGNDDEASSWKPHALSVDKLYIPPKHECIRHMMSFPPGDLHFSYLPASLSSGVHELEWADDQTYGSVGMLDLTSSNQVGQLFRYTQPKAFFAYDPIQHRDVFESLLDVVLPLAKKHLGKVKVYFCPFDKCADVLNAFGLSRSDLPCALIDDTAVGSKFVQPSDEFAASASVIEAFWKKHIDL